jgi:6-pyruvoyltetrahydropterin/6-carboxytetrahydropterin synthase
VSASVTVRVEWEMGHRLPHHEGACRQLHGHRYVAEVTMRGEINHEPMSPSEGMVIDFTDVKTLLKAEVLKLDHKFLLHRYDELAGVLSGLPGVVLVDFVPTAENIATALLNALPDVSCVKLWETATSYAEVTI